MQELCQLTKQILLRHLGMKFARELWHDSCDELCLNKWHDIIAYNLIFGNKKTAKNYVWEVMICCVWVCA